MISSSALDINTPQKEFIFNDSVTPIKVDKTSRAIKMTAADSRALTQMQRSHNFLRHEEIRFFDLREFSIDMRTADMISRFLQKNIDIPDAILRMEEIACSRHYYTDFLAKYIAEEYSIEENYSFCVVALLHYCRSNQVSLDEAITELVYLSSDKTICVQCCTEGESSSEKEYIANKHNFGVLKSLDYDISDDELFSDDDSVFDPPYTQISHDEESLSSSHSSADVNVKEAQPREDSEGKIYCNPFDSSSEEEDMESVRTGLNSSVYCNPFYDDDNNDESTSLDRKSKSACPHCGRKFSNSHNMKLHVIGLVILD